jgi:hypothetical protein
MVSYSESDDMVNWPAMHFALEPDERDGTSAPSMILDPTKLVVKREDVLPQRDQRTAAEGGKPGEFPFEGRVKTVTERAGIFKP